MRTLRLLTTILVVLPFISCQAICGAQESGPSFDQEMVDKIIEEGMERSQVMDSISYMTDVHGPRLTGSPLTRQAGEWAKQRMGEWGLENVHFENWGPFGRGWTLEGFKANMVAPNFSPLIGYPKAWSPSTRATVRGVPIYLDVQSEEDLEKYRGKLRQAIVLMSPPRDVSALFEPSAKRKTDEELLKLANADPSARRSRSGAAVAEALPADGTRPSGRAGASTAANQPTRPAVDPRAAFRMQTEKWRLVYDEGAAVVLEPGRGDGGTVFVGSATLPRAAGGSGFTPGPRPWSADVQTIVPQVVLAVEHYNRIVRMLERGAEPELEIDLAAHFHDDDLNSFNVIAEIPGTDLKDEVVMVGGHFDSWHTGTGATDNAIGCGVAMEAMRILKAIDAKPRRTIRIGLWTGEEQGLYGSRAYVEQHFGRAVRPQRGEGAEGQRPRTKYELKPAHEKFCGYFNLDNGTGKIRGIYLQGNEQVGSIFRSWLTPFAEMDASTVTASNTGGTDHLSFDSLGLPGFQFIQDPIEYDTRTHHSSMDVYDRIQVEDAKQASIIMATFAYNAAMRDDLLPRKPLDGEIVKVDDTAEPASSEAKPESENSNQ